MKHLKVILTSIALSIICQGIFAQGKRLVVHKGHWGSVGCVVFSPDGKLFATGGRDQTVKLWNAQNGTLLYTLHQNLHPVTSVAFSPDGSQLISGSEDLTFCLWETRTGQLLKKVVAHPQKITSVAFSPNGSQILTASQDHTAKIWNAKNFSLIHTLQGHQASVNKAVFSPNGQQILTVSSDKTARLWQSNSGKLTQTFRGHKYALQYAAFSSKNSQVVVTADRRMIKRWDITSGRVIQNLDAYQSFFIDIIFNYDGESYLVAVPEQGWVYTHQLSSNWITEMFRNKDDQVYAMAYHPASKRLLLLLSNGRIQCWQLPRKYRVYSTSTQKSPTLKQGVVSPDGKKVVLGYFDYLHTLGFTAAPTSNTKPTKKLYWNSLDLAPDHTTLALSGSFYLKNAHPDCIFLDLNTQQIRKSFRQHLFEINAVKYAPNGKSVATSRNDSIKLWDITTGKARKHFVHPNQQTVTGLEFSKQGHRLVTRGIDSTVKVWDVRSAKLLQNYQKHQGQVFFATFTNDGTKVLSGGREPDFTAHLWEAKSGKTLLKLVGHQGKVYEAAVSPDNQKVATVAGDGKVRIWNLQTGQLLRSLPGRTGWPRSAFFVSGGQKLWTVTVTGEMSLWETNTGRLLATLYTGFERKEAWVVVTPKGKYDGNASGLDYLYYTKGLQKLSIEIKDGPNRVKGLLQKLLD